MGCSGEETVEETLAEPPSDVEVHEPYSPGQSYGGRRSRMRKIGWRI